LRFQFNFVVIRFLFTNNARMTSLVGDKFVAGMIGTLCDALEAEYGILVPRLYRIFKPLRGNINCMVMHIIKFETNVVSCVI